MYTMRFDRPTLLTGIAAAVLVAFAAGPATAGHGLTMKEHPLRGDFPTANDTASSASAEDAAAADPRPVGSPERASAERAWVVTSGLGETWSCTVHAAGAQATDSDPTTAVMRVIHLAQ